MFVRACARAQQVRSFEVAVACPKGGDLAHRLAQADIPRVDWAARRAVGPTSLKEALALKKLIADWCPDVVHLHSSKAGLAGRLFRHPGTVVVFQPHAWSFEHVGGPVGWGALRWERRAIRRCHAVICVSEAERARGVQHGIEGDLRVIPNGVSLEEWSVAGDSEQASARSALGYREGPLVVCVGRLSVQKGQDVLLTAWEEVARRVPTARLVLVGEGPLRPELTRRAVPGVALVGSSDEVPRWMAAADVIAMPSRWEGMSLTMLETMARGRPLVATDVAGVREAMGDADAIVPPEDPWRLAAALIERLQNPELARDEGRRLRARVEEHFSFDRTEDAIARLYLELLERHAKS